MAAVAIKLNVSSRTDVQSFVIESAYPAVLSTPVHDDDGAVDGIRMREGENQGEKMCTLAV